MVDQSRRRFSLGDGTPQRLYHEIGLHVAVHGVADHTLREAVDATLEKQLLHVPVGDGQAVIEVDGVADDPFGETVAFGTLGRVAYLKTPPDPK